MFNNFLLSIDTKSINLLPFDVSCNKLYCQYKCLHSLGRIILILAKFTKMGIYVEMGVDSFGSIQLTLAHDRLALRKI